MRRGVVPDVERERLLAALRQVDEANTELRDAVVAANKAGGSVREIAKVIGKTTQTVQRWLREG